MLLTCRLLKFYLEVFELFAKSDAIWTSLSAAGKIDVTTMLLKLERIKYANTSPFFIIIFVGIWLS